MFTGRIYSVRCWALVSSLNSVGGCRQFSTCQLPGSRYDALPQMFTPNITAWVSAQGQRAHVSFAHHRSLSTARRVRSGFTLLELLIVISIIAILLVSIPPAFTTIKGGTDVTSAAYTVKGVLDTARTYAKANNTYTWVGFYEENGANATSPNSDNPAVGRVIVSIVASKDGSTVYNSNSLDPTKLIQVGKLVKIDNMHFPIFNPGNNTGVTFDTRPWPSPTPTPANDSRFGEINLSGSAAAPTTNTQFPFQYPVGSPAPTAQYTFQKTLQFNPRGESTINSGLGVGGITYNVKPIVEIGLIQTHGIVVPTPTPSAGNYVGNVVAIQISGFSGSVKIYRR